MAELAACNAGTKVVIADGDAVVLEVVGKIIVALCHGSDEDGDALVLVEVCNVITYTHDVGVETERDLAAVGRQVVGDGVLDDLDELLLRLCRANLMAVEQLDHQTSESLESSGKAHAGGHFDQHILGCLNVDLEPARLVDRRIQEGEETLRGTH